MASSSAIGHAANGELSAAQKLMQKAQEEAHNPTIEDIPDEDDLRHGEAPISSSVLETPTDDVSAPQWNAPMSAKAAGKQKATEVPATKLDTQSHDLFPELGGAAKSQAPAALPSWGAKKGGSNGVNGSPATSAPASGIATPTDNVAKAATKVLLPGRVEERISLAPEHLLPRSQMRKPVADVIKDVNKKSRATVTSSTGLNNTMYLTAVGPRDACRTALNEITNQIGSKQSIKVPIPRSLRAHVIGKGGATIKALQERTGARIQMPRNEDGPGANDDDDDATVDVIVEGNALTAEMARNEIVKLVGDRAPPTTTRVRNIPAEFYPFLAGPNNSRARELEEANDGVRVQIPQYHRWTSQRPPQPSPSAPASFTAAHPENHITITGDRTAAAAVKQAFEMRAKELARQLAVDQFSLQTGYHQFIIGNRGIPAHDFLSETGCHVILPTDPEDDVVTIVGPVDRIRDGVDRAMDLASSMQSSNVDISRQHRSGGPSHARNVTRYLQQRNEIERLQKAHEAHIVTPSSSSGYAPWQLFYRDGKAGIRAQSEINSIVNGHPPSRMANVNVDPFYYAHLRKEVAPKVQEAHGVLVVIPAESEKDAQVLLVFEGPDGADADYQVPRTQPTAADAQAFQRGLEDASKHILDLIEAQESVTTRSIDVPQKFHEKLRKFIKREQQDRAADQIPIRVSATGTIVTLRGPASSVEALSQKVEAFIAQETEDEKERGFTLSFDFPQKHANKLIGASGANIMQLRDRFDVDIQVKDGVVELKGPKAKAEAAKAHITSQGKQWADESTHTLKVDPNFHRGLIGRGGENLTKLQDKYKGVQIHFPRAAKSAKEEEDAEGSDSGAPAPKPRRQQAADEVIVRGPSKAADATRDEILSLLQYLKDTSYTQTIVVPQKHVGSLMGAGGKSIEEIRTTSGAKVEIPNPKDQSESTDQVEIQISGTKAQVEAAKKLIIEKKSVLDRTVTQNLDVDRKHHSALIGGGGRTLQEIIAKAGGPEDRMQQTRMVQFPKADSDVNSIRIVGDKDVVDKIIAAMKDIVSERESQVTEVIDVPISKHRNLIGQGGKTKKDLETKLGVSINIPRQGDGSTSVRLMGKPEKVEAAKTHILDLVKEEEGETVQVPRSAHHSVADNGQFFRRLRNSRVIVDHAGHKVPPKPSAPAPRSNGNGALPLITDSQDDSSEDSHTWQIVPSSTSDLEGEIPWVFRGPPEAVAAAKQQLAAALVEAQLNTMIGYLTLQDTTKHRYIIGQKGTKIDQIRSETGCKITVPKEVGSYEPIEVLGSEEGVEKARELMLEAIRDGSAPRN